MLLLLFQGRRIKKLEELYGIQNGGNHGNQHTGGRSNNVGCGNNQYVEDTTNVGNHPHTQ